MILKDYTYEQINLGYICQFKRMITEQNINNFAELTGDFNPLHLDKNYAKISGFKDIVVHGMLAGSLFSTLVGMLCPGKRCLYLSQTLQFRRPIYPETEVIVKGKVINKIDGVKIVIIDTQILMDKTVVISGEAKVKVLGD